ncbi:MULTISPECIES: hypothetical protein [unclassified Streptomyces]|uniref:hypothetical protein n=1 Tax=unclassified Streptomyces TaxID=2593676 RepID=UPI0011A7B538|nr:MULTISPECIES: hypothetical protein [Streptomyces]QHC32822.1 hypothetical protein GR129_32635 [Streptomyces sp. HF10]WKE73300.1 hypothetical protein QHG49_31960 [Streptomyces sp. WP-1]
MPTRPTTLRALAGAALLPLALVTPAWGGPAAAPAPKAEDPATLCAVAGTLRGDNGQYALVNLCAGSGTPQFAVSAPASCGRAGTRARYSCRTNGTWTATRSGKTLAGGPLPGSGDYPGPGTYDITATVRVRSAPAGVDLTGQVRATLTLTAPKAPPTHAITVDRTTLRRDATTTLTYTVRRDSAQGDGSARFGLIGEAGSGVRIATSDARCVNPLVGEYPSKDRLPYSLDCALTELQPGHPEQVKVRVTVGATCSTVVSKLGYWMPDGQALYTGGMLEGPELTCA